MKIDQLHFYRLMYTQNEILGNMIIEIPITRENFISFIYKPEFHLVKEKFQHYILNYDILNLSRSQDWIENKEIKIMKIILYFSLGEKFYKKINKNILIKRLFYGKETLLMTVNHLNYKIKNIYDEEFNLDINFDYLKFFTNIYENVKDIKFKCYIRDLIQFFNTLETLTNE